MNATGLKIFKRPSLFSASLLLIIFLFSTCQSSAPPAYYDVIVLGAGTGATSAAVQSARSQAKTLWINPLEWPGGMLTAAGVSATDGNHRLPAGLWAEFRDSLRSHYGGVDALFTGWVSNTMFEPSTGAHYWERIIANEPQLSVWKNSIWSTIEKKEHWTITTLGPQGSSVVTARILVDGTDLGDVAAAVGATYDLGMDARSTTGESMAPEKANDIIQDLTYAAILKDYGPESDHTIPQPEGYDPSVFYCACQHPKCSDGEAHPCDKMLSYGKLPNGKYMINWPKFGNDHYVNIVEASSRERLDAYRTAKLKTLQFIYYLQDELGYKNLGLADDEFPTDDQLPLYPYHREGRRIHGLTQLNVNHILEPYDFTLYRTGIAVGDYPIDHHHAEHPNAPEIDFPSVPSFAIPMGSLIPKNVEDLLVADKPISVTNIVNGSSRLQPVILQIGQAAGLMAAMAAKQEVSPGQLDVRAVQEKLLACDGYILPLIDVTPDDSHFKSIQRVVATGLLQAKGIPYQWANQTWFYPDSLVTTEALITSLRQYQPALDFESSVNPLNIETAIAIVDKVTEDNYSVENIREPWSSSFGLTNFTGDRAITKRELAVLLDQTLDPFHKWPVDLKGALK
jgi:hypothetical protein